MHGDKKIGLALGVLLVGVVGALFFRNERLPDDPVPELKTAASVDAQIEEEHSISPYLGAPETDGDENRSENDDWSVASSGSDDSGSLDMSQLLGNEASPVQGSAPDPIRVGPNDTSEGGEDRRRPAVDAGKPRNASSTTGPGWNSDWSSSDERSPTSSNSTEKTSVWYTVQDGDTLSEIASKYLGSSARYNEIFEANRDVLKSPGDVRAGDRLRIPSRKSLANKPETTNTIAQSDNERTSSQPPADDKTEDRVVEPVSDRGESAKIRFVPASRPPLGRRPGGSTTSTRRQSTDDRSTSDSGNKPAKETSASGARTYTVQRGDTLGGIAVRFYGSRTATSKIFAANRHILSNPNDIRERMVLTLP